MFPRVVILFPFSRPTQLDISSKTSYGAVAVSKSSVVSMSGHEQENSSRVKTKRVIDGDSWCMCLHRGFDIVVRKFVPPVRNLMHILEILSCFLIIDISFGGKQIQIFWQLNWDKILFHLLQLFCRSWLFYWGLSNWNFSLILCLCVSLCATFLFVPCVFWRIWLSSCLWKFLFKHNYILLDSTPFWS